MYKRFGVRGSFVLDARLCLTKQKSNSRQVNW